LRLRAPWLDDERTPSRGSDLDGPFLRVDSVEVEFREEEVLRLAVEGRRRTSPSLVLLSLPAITGYRP